MANKNEDQQVQPQEEPPKLDAWGNPIVDKLLDGEQLPETHDSAPCGCF